MSWNRGVRAGVVLVVMVSLTGCASLVSSAGSRMAQSLGEAVASSNDPQTVHDGLPAYLLLVDGMIAGDPSNPELLLSGARLYSSYATAFVSDPERTQRLATKGRDYGWQGLCRSQRQTCGIWSAPYEEFASAVERLARDDVPALFGCAAAWATWIQANRSDWVAVADKARVELMMQRVVTLDERFERGAAHLYLGVLDTLLPAALGGKPEEGRQHYERALDLSEGRNLMAKTLLARDYARLVFDRELHDRLCREVTEADPREPGLTLSNVLAIEEAQRLLASANDYFGE